MQNSKLPGVLFCCGIALGAFGIGRASVTYDGRSYLPADIAEMKLTAHCLNFDPPNPRGHDDANIYPHIASHEYKYEAICDEPSVGWARVP